MNISCVFTFFSDCVSTHVLAGTSVGI